MKITFNKYLYFITLLLLNVFASIQANDINVNIEEVSNTYNFKTTQYSTESYFSNKITNTFFSQSLNEIEHNILFDLIESDELEDEEASSRHKSQYTESQETAFNNAKLFEYFSKELQKKIQRPYRVVHMPNIRLHHKYEVFVI